MSTINFTLSPEVKTSLINKLAVLLDFLTNEKHIRAYDISMRLGINSSALSLIKNRKYTSVSDMRVIIAAVSFNIETEGFLSNLYLVELRSGKALSGYPLGSNLYRLEIDEFNSRVRETKKDVMDDWKKDEAIAALAGKRMHQQLEAEITNFIPGFGPPPERKSKPIPDASRFDPSKYISRQTAEEISKYAGTVESITAERDELNRILADYDRLKKRRDDLNQILTLIKNNLL